MLRTKTIAMAVLLTTIGASQISAQSGPSIIGDQGSDECQFAQGMAKSAFISTSPSLYWPVIAPSGTENKIIVARQRLDISGGGDLFVDPSTFERLERQGNNRGVILWERHPLNGRRIVFIDEPFNWRGDQYYLLSVPVDVTQESFDQYFQTLPPVNRSALQTNWNLPLVLLTTQTGKIWAIDYGVLYSTLQKWHILVASSEDFISPCHISFTQGRTPGLARLPLNVQRFATLADEALGPERSPAGTLRPTAHIRSNVNRGWITLTERPWALLEGVYNSRKEIDAGLEAWAMNSPARERLYEELQDTYKLAERELADFYAIQFLLTDEQARGFSTYAMDHMLRRYFVFHSDFPRAGQPTETPWPEDVR